MNIQSKNKYKISYLKNKSKSNNYYLEQPRFCYIKTYL